MIVSAIVFWVSIFIIFFAMVGYPMLLKVLDKMLKPAQMKKNETYEPQLTYMIVAHNEEKVILKKLQNALKLDYPSHKIQILVASDNSSDKTNLIVEQFIKEHSDRDIVLYQSVEHKGKTNAQNEAQKHATGDILVMTDANTMLHTDALRELVSSFTDEDIAYVCGKLVYSNQDDNSTSQSESTYWDMELQMRDIESRFHTITAGNGAIYACRNNEYIDFNPISCHDSVMPYTYSMMGKRALFNPQAVAVEKAGETDEDEFKRKVRMNRDILDMLKMGFKAMNVFKLHWFSLFYFGHRTCRYLLWASHILAILASFAMACMNSVFGLVCFVGQVAFFMLAALALKMNSSNAILHLVGYYGMTVFAQMKGVWNIITGKAKPIWEKAESTR